MNKDLLKYFSLNMKNVESEIKKVIPLKVSEEWLKMFFNSSSDLDISALQKEYSEPVWDLLNRGGKRWRPMLLLLACESLKGNKNLAMKFTPLPELIHNGTLIADDIEDNAFLRRGKKTLHLSHGIDTSINASNTLYFISLELLFNNANSLSEQKINKIYNLYAKQMIAVSFGQALDIRWHKESFIPSKEQYLKMVSLKTGALSRFAAELGAIIANASNEQQKALGDFAESLGTAFQIQDDILSINSSKYWGKDLAEDISEGKKTLIIIKALEELNKDKKKELLDILSKQTKEKKQLKRAVEIIKETKAISFAEQTAHDVVRKSWESVDSVVSESNSKKLLFEFLQFVVTRKI